MPEECLLGHVESEEHGHGQHFLLVLMGITWLTKQATIEECTMEYIIIPNSPRTIPDLSRSKHASKLTCR